jgi:hypothetical protein
VTDPNPDKAAAPASATAPAGWYPVAGTTQQRWWDGSAWTDHVYDSTLASTAGALKAPEGTNPSTVWFWLLAVGAPVIQLAGVLLESVWFNSLGTVDYADPTALAEHEFTPTYLALVLLGWVGYALFVVDSALDYRVLRARGVPRPFHWAWAFLSVYVYAIGRSVVARRRTGTGLTPLWVFVALNAVVLVIGIVVVIGYLSAVVSQVSNLSN